MAFDIPPAAMHVTVAQTEIPIKALRWERRVLVVFAGKSADSELAKQRAELAGERSELRERDLTVVEVVGDSVSGIRDYAPRLRAEYGISRDGFAAVLIGKDGAAKLKSRKPIASETLFATIDAMPMRRQEMSDR